MPITLNGSGSITGLSAGGLPDASITLSELDDAVVSRLNRAWVNFNGTGTVAIRSSFNVTSVTDVATGRYTVNFTSAMPDANYCTVATAGSSTAGAAYLDARISGSPTESGVTVSSHMQNSGNPTYSDVNNFNVIVMG